MNPLSVSSSLIVKNLTFRNMQLVFVYLTVILASAVLVESNNIHCLKACRQPTVAQPVCARSVLNPSNQRQFASQCEVDRINCNFPLYYVVSSAACPAVGTAVQCGTVCPVTFSPVCAFQYGNIFSTRTFDNQCELINFNCANTGSVFVQISNTACLF